MEQTENEKPPVVMAAGSNRSGGSGASGASAGLKFEKYFTLSASVSQRTVGEIDGGYRVDFDYGSPTTGAAIVGVSSGAPALTKTLTKIVSGASVNRPSAGDNIKDALIASGSDWVFVSDEGFVDLDSKITLTLQNLPTACLLGLQLVGRADLRDSKDATGRPIFPAGNETAEQVVAKWRAGLGQGSYIPLLLGVTIDVPVSGTNRQQTTIYEECHPLGHSILVGLGRAVLDQNSQIANVSLSVGKAT